MLHKVKQLVKEPVKSAMYAAASSGRDVRYALARLAYESGVVPHFNHPREIGLIQVDPGALLRNNHQLNPSRMNPNHFKARQGSADYPSSLVQRFGQHSEQIDQDVISKKSSASDSIIKLPENYFEIIDRIAVGTEKKLSVANENIYYFGDKGEKRRYDAGIDLPACTWDTEVYTNRRLKTLRSKTCDDVDGVEDLCQAIMPSIEREIFNSYVEVASSFVERKFGHENVKPVSLYHSDRHYEDTIRMIVYLNDIDETAAPFEYLRHKETGKTVRIPTSDHPKLTLNGRIPDELVQRHLANGFEKITVVGKKGTFIIFDSKIIHKASNVLGDVNRTVLVLPIRPALRKPKRYVDPKNVEGVYV